VWDFTKEFSEKTRDTGHFELSMRKQRVLGVPGQSSHQGHREKSRSIATKTQPVVIHVEGAENDIDREAILDRLDRETGRDGALSLLSGDLRRSLKRAIARQRRARRLRTDPH
jgi:hypothetical protein